MADRVSQVATEVLVQQVAGQARVSQVATEVLVSHQPITNTLLSQFVLEVLVPTTYPYDKQIITVEARVTGLFNKIEWGDGLHRHRPGERRDPRRRGRRYRYGRRRHHGSARQPGCP